LQKTQTLNLIYFKFKLGDLRGSPFLLPGANHYLYNKLKGELVMKKRSLLLLFLVFFPLFAMKRPLEKERLPLPEMQEASSASKVPKVPAEQESPKELSTAARDHIASLRRMAERGEFSDEIAAEILVNLAKTKVAGATQDQKLYNAIAAIRNFMEAFPQFYGDAPINKNLIEELAKRYTQGNAMQVAIALATTGSGQWLVAHVGNNADRIKKVGYELVRAAGLGDLSAVRFILAYAPQVINEKGKEERTSLMAGAFEGHLAVVKRLLEVPGINVNAQNQQGGTALMAAAQNGHAPVVERLLQAPGINVNSQTQTGATALMFAASKGHAAVVERLLQVPGINVNVQSQPGFTALMFAAQNGHVAIVERLLQVPGINVNQQNQKGSTALTLAAENGHAAIVERLLQMPGINVNMQNQQGVTALMFAASKGHAAVVERLLQVPGININLQDQQGGYRINICC
jgi:ankyrin repeat protein